MRSATNHLMEELHLASIGSAPFSEVQIPFATLLPSPKNNAGRDLMADSPAPISEAQLKELAIKLELNR